MSMDHVNRQEAPQEDQGAIDRTYNYVKNMGRWGMFGREELMEIAEDNDVTNPERIWDELVEEQSEWPSPTDCELLDQAFKKLMTQGVMCHPIGAVHPGNTNTELLDDLRQIGQKWSEKEGGAEVLAYIGFNTQAIQRAVENDALYVTFWGRANLYKAREVTQAIEDALDEVGIQYHFPKAARRIRLEIKYQRRLPQINSTK